MAEVWHDRHSYGMGVTYEDFAKIGIDPSELGALGYTWDKIEKMNVEQVLGIIDAERERRKRGIYDNLAQHGINTAEIDALGFPLERIENMSIEQVTEIIRIKRDKEKKRILIKQLISIINHQVSKNREQVLESSISVSDPTISPFMVKAKKLIAHIMVTAFFAMWTLYAMGRFPILFCVFFILFCIFAEISLSIAMNGKSIGLHFLSTVKSKFRH